MRGGGDKTLKNDYASHTMFFHICLQVATLVQDLRKELDRILENKIENPSLDLMSCARESRIIDAIVRLISTQ